MSEENFEKSDVINFLKTQSSIISIRYAYLNFKDINPNIDRYKFYMTLHEILPEKFSNRALINIYSKKCGISISEGVS